MSQFFNSIKAISLSVVFGCTIQSNAQTSISGTVLNDGTGMTDSIINGVGINNTDGQSLKVYLVRSSDSRVMDSANVNSQGNYSLSGSNGVQYSVMLSINDYAIGTTNPLTTLDPNWVFTCEQFGTNNNSGTGMETSTGDGSIALNTDSAVVDSVYFGINKRPQAVDRSVYLSKSPNHNTSQNLNGSDYDSISIVDLEDGEVEAQGKTLRIASVSGMNGNILRYKGKVISGDTTIDNFSVTNLKIEFVGSGSTNLSFTFTMYDSAGFQDLSPATYQVNWFGALPVEWHTFNARELNNEVLLEWSTAMEWNNEVFIVERLDKNKQFEVIGTVAAIGFSNEINSYSFVDRSPQNGTNYYRITQMDFDGTTSSTRVISVEIENPMSVDIYPNPFVSSLSISCDDPAGCSAVNVSIIDQAGRVVDNWTTDYSMNTGSIEVDMTQCKSGFYFIQLSNGTDVQVHKVLKL